MTPVTSPPSTLAGVPAAVEQILGDFFEIGVGVAADIDPAVGAAAVVLRDFVLSGGKRVRPTLAYAGWLAATADGAPVGGPGGSDAPGAADALRVGAALELIQGCALIHDDIIDRSDTRRGRPTVHRALEARHADQSWTGDAASFGVATAILIGDLALSWADDLIRGAGPAASAVTGGRDRLLPPAVGAVWSAMRTEVLGGQLLDIVNEVRGDESAAAAYRVMEFKTAAYTVARPLELGAALAGASPSLIGDLRTVGHDLGIAFQLRDDLLGVFGDPEQTGKPSGDDLVEGKRTVLIAEAFTRASADDAALLRARLGTALTPDEVAEVRDVLDRCGARESVEGQIDDLLDRALTTLDAMPIAASVRTELTDIARSLTHRQK